MKQTIIFIDGQNLYHLAKDAWGYSCQTMSPYCYPSYDVQKLGEALTGLSQDRALKQIRFYTGVPDIKQNKFWHGFWDNKLRYLKSRGIYVYKGRVNPGNQEKGVDVSISVDLIQLTYEKSYDVAILVSQDWDFGPAVKLAKKIAINQCRQLEFESCFPYEQGQSNRTIRGIPGTKWVHITKSLYDSCFDHTDYRKT